MVQFASIRLMQPVQPRVTALVPGQTARGQEILKMGADGPGLVEFQDDQWKPVASLERLKDIVQNQQPGDWGRKLARWYDGGPFWRLFQADGKVVSEELRPLADDWIRSETVAQEQFTPLGEDQPATFLYKAGVVPAAIHLGQQGHTATWVEPRVIDTVTHLNGPYSTSHCVSIGHNSLPRPNGLPMLEL